MSSEAVQGRRFTEKPADPPFSKDIRSLITKFAALNTTKISQFRELWKSVVFSKIHDGKTDDIDPKDFIQELYCACLGYLILPSPFVAQIAVIYILYFLYETQHNVPKVKIDVSIEIFEQLLRMREQGIAKNVVDLIAVLNRLHAIHAFSYVTVVKVDPVISNIKEQTNNPQLFAESTPLPRHLINNNNLKDAINIDRFQQISVNYQHLKEALLMDVNVKSVPDIKDPLTRSEQDFHQSLLRIAQNHQTTNEARRSKFKEEWKKEIVRENGRLLRLQNKPIKEADANKKEQREENDDNWVAQVINTIRSKVNPDALNASYDPDLDYAQLNAPQNHSTNIDDDDDDEEIDMSAGPTPLQALTSANKEKDFIDEFILDATTRTITRDELQVDDQDDMLIDELTGDVTFKRKSKRSGKEQRKWSDEEVIKLGQAFDEIGNHIPEIQRKYFPDRTISSVRFKLKSVMKQKSGHDGNDAEKSEVTGSDSMVTEKE
ncbi:snRNA-activating protein complex subunit 1 [Acrasis kona]|uniref:snRNA-activating protein complex subunit 1 n=1 Tax=Acrasis kona TaxID=1008807 RepID=A0AAW2Z1A4_9EUKA